ncbi:hypothetical protein BLOT_014774 [Blomia tropicalis]|nr:hypothetical protein BLOT_014774 [Blomia tropicalis]
MLEWNHKSFPIHFDDLPLRQLITQQRVEILYELTLINNRPPFENEERDERVSLHRTGIIARLSEHMSMICTLKHIDIGPSTLVP